MTPFRWTARGEQAAALVAADQQSDAEIAAACGLSKRTLERWKRHPEFTARVAEHVEATRQAVRARGIAERQNRVDALNDRWQRMRQVVDARAADPAHADVPGWTSGLLVRQVSISPAGTETERYAVDTGLLRELRAHEEQAAKELGQWTEKHEHSGELLVRRYVGIDPDAV